MNREIEEHFVMETVIMNVGTSNMSLSPWCILGFCPEYLHGSQPNSLIINNQEDKKEEKNDRLERDWQ